jgi:hypothetical protein
VADFLQHHLQNYAPEVTVVPARKRGTLLSPDDPQVLKPLLPANVLFMGAGSPTYACRQLQGSLAWQVLQARHRLGSAVVLASAATIAASAYALPVYEIYKVGDDLHWHPGLDFFGPYGLSLALVSHWDNKEGGAELDTSRGFIGRARFEELLHLLPHDMRIAGIDEHTAVALDLVSGRCLVMGRGGITLCHGRAEKRYQHGESFPVSELGPFRLPDLQEGITPEVWEMVRTAEAESGTTPEPPPEVLALVRERTAARSRRDWAAADDLRERLAALGWNLRDTPDGPELEALNARR